MIQTSNNPMIEGSAGRTPAKEGRKEGTKQARIDRASERTNDQRRKERSKRTKERTNGRTNKRTNEQTDERTNKRTNLPAFPQTDRLPAFPQTDRQTGVTQSLHLCTIPHQDTLHHTFNALCTPNTYPFAGIFANWPFGAFGSLFKILTGVEHNDSVQGWYEWRKNV